MPNSAQNSNSARPPLFGEEVKAEVKTLYSDIFDCPSNTLRTDAINFWKRKMRPEDRSYCQAHLQYLSVLVQAEQLKTLQQCRAYLKALLGEAEDTADAAADIVAHLGAEGASEDSPADDSEDEEASEPEGETQESADDDSDEDDSDDDDDSDGDDSDDDDSESDDEPTSAQKEGSALEGEVIDTRPPRPASGGSSLRTLLRGNAS